MSVCAQHNSVTENTLISQACLSSGNRLRSSTLTFGIVKGEFQGSAYGFAATSVDALKLCELYVLQDGSIIEDQGEIAASWL